MLTLFYLRFQSIFIFTWQWWPCDSSSLGNTLLSKSCKSHSLFNGTILHTSKKLSVQWVFSSFCYLFVRSFIVFATVSTWGVFIFKLSFIGTGSFLLLLAESIVLDRFIDRLCLWFIWIWEWRILRIMWTCRIFSFIQGTSWRFCFFISLIGWEFS